MSQYLVYCESNIRTIRETNHGESDGQCRYHALQKRQMYKKYW